MFAVLKIPTDEILPVLYLGIPAVQNPEILEVQQCSTVSIEPRNTARGGMYLRSTESRNTAKTRSISQYMKPKYCRVHGVPEVISLGNTFALLPGTGSFCAWIAPVSTCLLYTRLPVAPSVSSAVPGTCQRYLVPRAHQRGFAFDFSGLWAYI